MQSPASLEPVSRSGHRLAVSRRERENPVSSVLRSQRPLMAGVAVYLLARAITWAITGTEYLEIGANPLITWTSLAVIACWSAIFFTLYLVRATFFDRTTGGLLASETWRRFHHSYTAPARLLNAGVVIVLYMIASDTFVSFKAAISTSLPFMYDEAFARADEVIHGGFPPWTLLHPILSTPWITRALWINYTYPFFLGIGGLIVWLAWTRRAHLRDRVLLTMLLMWALLGTVLAALFPAAGPAFYQHVTGQTDFVPLMEYLRGVHEAAGLPPLAVQDQLWSEWSQGRALHGGISAMPSMHVAMATLFALIGWQLNRWLGAIATIFTFGIVLGSVHLGWHYAIDGYVAVPLTVSIWIVVGKGLSRAAAPDPDP